MAVIDLPAWLVIVIAVVAATVTLGRIVRR